MDPLSVGVDVGGTNIKGVAITADGSVLHRKRAPTDPNRETSRDTSRDTNSEGRNVEDQICDFINEFLRELRSDMRTDVAGAGADAGVVVGVVVPGILDEDAGVVEFSANLGFQELALREMLEMRLSDKERDLRVLLGHDVRQGGVAEGRFGAARGVADYAFVPIGTGIAASFVLGGKPWRGSHGFDGEIGHVRVSRDPTPCSCGGHGCLETVASGAAITRRYREKTGEDLAASEVFQRARAGDDDAALLWRGAVEGLAYVLACVHAALDLEMVVIGGGVSTIGTPLTDVIDSEIRDRIAVGNGLRVTPAQLGDDAGAVGAALLALGSTQQPDPLQSSVERGRGT